MRRNACARKVGWRSRPFPSGFFPSFFDSHLSVHIPFVHSLGLFRPWSSTESSAKRVRNKPRSICACYVSLIQFCTAASLSLLSLITFSDLYIYFFLFLSFLFFPGAFLFLPYAPRAICTVKNSESSLKRARKKWHETHAVHSSDANFTRAMNVRWDEFVRSRKLILYLPW